MPRTVFPYPGGKTKLSNWILEHLPDHDCFVEVFGGAAAVLVNKDPDVSTVEVYNDTDEDLVQFFEILREQPDELVEWLAAAPYSRSLHEEWADLYYRGYRPTDDIERAGRFFFLRYTQWGAKYDSGGGFGTSKVSNPATSFSNKIDILREFAERFDDVVLENLDWDEVLSKYDSAETVFYCDPPYIGKEDYYPAGSIDHERFAETLADLDGNWLCSYEDLPAGLQDFPVLSRDERFFINNGKTGSTNEATERLVANFDFDQDQPAE
ncbi:DNA adenine methylase [Halobaculum sp. P14]|uniref:DNA adenine methylase n=1 Tax=Halobaculum sp. P14 TaxID=3421638 RepID=UPI003EBD0B86